MASFCEQFTFRTSSRHSSKAALFLDVSIFAKLFWRVWGFEICFSAVILGPRRHDRRGPIVCVSHSERQNGLADGLSHVGQTKMGRNHIPPFLSQLSHLSLIMFSFLPSQPKKSQCHFRTASVTKRISEETHGFLVCSLILLQNLHKTYLPGILGDCDDLNQQFPLMWKLWGLSEEYAPKVRQNFYLQQ